MFVIEDDLLNFLVAYNTLCTPYTVWKGHSIRLWKRGGGGEGKLIPYTQSLFWVPLCIKLKASVWVREVGSVGGGGGVLTAQWRVIYSIQ